MLCQLAKRSVYKKGFQIAADWIPLLTTQLELWILQSDQSQRNLVASIWKAFHVKITRPKNIEKKLPCSCPILFSRSDTSISTSMISKSFEMHSLIINPVNEFFYQSKWISVFYNCTLRLLFWYFCHFPVTYSNWPIISRLQTVFLSWPWPLLGYKSVSS